jgi:hypothetical protein
MKFKKIPVIIDAEQWFPNKHVNGVEFPILTPGGYQVRGYIGQGLLKHHGAAIAYINSGDWIITDEHNNKFSCAPDIFDKTYKAIED